MTRKFALKAAAVSLVLIAGAASAEMYVDYMPEKGVWQIAAVEVDPNHVNDYLVGLRRSQVPGFEIMKRRGLLDDYKFVVRDGYVKGRPNVLIMTHLPSVALLAPDQVRDQAVEKEILASFSREQGRAAVAGYEKYRSFLDQANWSEVSFAR